MQNGGPRFCRGASCLRRSFHARGIASPFAVIPRALPDRQRAEDLGYAGNRRVSARDQTQSRPLSHRPRPARPLPFDLRRDAFRLHQPALGPAHEPQRALSRVQGLGRRARRYRAYHRDLARVSRRATRDPICLEETRAPPTPCMRRYARAFSPTISRLDPLSARYCRTIMALAPMQEWIAAAKLEPDELEELDMEF